jgi:hypothetical protein
VRDLGIVKPGTKLYIPFNTYDSNDPSASVTITGLAVTDIEIYKDDSIVQRASDSGYALIDTDGIDIDGNVGIHEVSIDLADNTTAGFYAAGSTYKVIIASITVDGATVNFVAARFVIGYPDALLNTTIAAYTSTDNFTLTTGSADDDAYNGWLCMGHDVASATQVQMGIIEDYTGSSKTVNLKADPGIFTMAASDNISLFPPALQPTVAGSTLDVTTTGTAGIDWGNVENKTTANDLSGTDIQLSDTTTTLTNKTGFSLAATGLDAIVSTATGMVEIAKAVWDRLLTGGTHNITNSAGRRLRQIDAAFEVHSGTAQAGTATTITLDTGADGTNNNIYRGDRCVIVAGTGIGEHGLIINYVASTRVATMSETWIVTPDNTSEFILVPADVDIETWNHNKVTGDGDWVVMQDDLDTITGAAGAVLDSTATSAQLVDDVWDEVITKAAHNVTNSAAQKLRTLSSNIIRVDTAQGAGTGTNQIQLDAGASAVDGSYDPSLVSIIAGTGIGQSRNILQYEGSTVTATVDRDWKVLPDATSEYAIVSDAGREHVNEGLAQAGAAGSITLNALASALDDAYLGQRIFIRSGTGADQAKLITDYNGTTKVALVDSNWGTTPDSTSAYVMLPTSPVSLSDATQASIDAIEDDTNELQGDWTDGGRLDLIIDAIKVPTDKMVFTVANQLDANMLSISGDGTAADALEASMETLIVSTATGTPTTTTMADSSLTETTNDHYNGRVIIWRTGALAGQATSITGYNGTTKTFTFTEVTNAASASDAYVLV